MLHDKVVGENAALVEVEFEEDKSVQKVEENSDDKKARSRIFKPYTNLSARQYRYRIMEIKILIMKIASPISNEKDEQMHQCAHVLEDTLNELYKLKENEAKALNCATCDADNCVLPQIADDSIIDDELSNF